MASGGSTAKLASIVLGRIGMRKLYLDTHLILVIFSHVWLSHMPPIYLPGPTLRRSMTE